jgi:hypothetical protein
MTHTRNQPYTAGVKPSMHSADYASKSHIQEATGTPPLGPAAVTAWVISKEIEMSRVPG